LIIKQAEAAAAPSGGNMSNLFASYLGQVYGDRYTKDKRKEIDPIATAAEKKRFDKTQRNLDRLAVGAGTLSAVDSFGRNLAEGKFRPISALGSGQAAYQGIKGTLNPLAAGFDDFRIKRRIRREMSPRSGSPTASSTYREPPTEFRTVDSTLFSEPKKVGVTRRATPAEIKRHNLPRGQQIFDMSTTGGLPDLTPEIKEPTRTMTEEQVKVLAPNVAPPTTQSNLNQFTEKDMVKIINRDDAEDAREEKRLNAKNIDGSDQIQGNV